LQLGTLFCCQLNLCFFCKNFWTDVHILNSLKKAKAKAKKGYRLKDLANLNLKIKIVLIFFNLIRHLTDSAFACTLVRWGIKIVCGIYLYRICVGDFVWIKKRLLRDDFQN